MQASILMRMSGLNHWFKTANQMQPGRAIRFTLMEGPFEQLEGEWQFVPLAEEGCKISLCLQFEVKRGLIAAILKPAFHHIANTMVDSFCTRAQAIHES